MEDTFEIARSAQGLNPALQLASAIDTEAEHINTSGRIHDAFENAAERPLEKIASFLMSGEVEQMLLAERKAASHEEDAVFIAPAIGWIEALRAW